MKDGKDIKETIGNDDLERFRTGAAKYGAYLETPEGRLRLDLAFANLQDFLPLPTQSLHALDLGCGTGAIATASGATWSSRHFAGCVPTDARFREA